MIDFPETSQEAIQPFQVNVKISYDLRAIKKRLKMPRKRFERELCKNMPYWDVEDGKLKNGSIVDKAYWWIEQHILVRGVIYYMGDSIWNVMPLNRETQWPHNYNNTIYKIENMKFHDGYHFTCGCQGYRTKLKDEGIHLCSHILSVKMLYGAINHMKAHPECPENEKPYYRRYIEDVMREFFIPFIPAVNYVRGSDPELDEFLTRFAIRGASESLLSEYIQKEMQKYRIGKAEKPLEAVQ